jgi:thioredoxin:protein disulfide reductase
MQYQRNVMMILVTLMMCCLGGLSAKASTVDPFSSSMLIKPKAPSKFMSVDQAFGMIYRLEGRDLVLNFRVTPEHYLYQDRFKIKAPDHVTIAEIQYNQPPSFEDDPDFGRVAVFAQDVELRTTISGQGVIPLEVKWQGCAKAGLCYPPQMSKIMIHLPAGKVGGGDVPMTQLERSAGVRSIRIPMPIPQLSLEQQVGHGDVSTVPLPVPEWMIEDEDELISSHSKTTAVPNSLPHIDEVVVDQDPFGLATYPLTGLVLLFLAGLGLAFTPCVLPMLPIVANLVARQHRRSAWHGLILAMAYSVGVACCYALLGALVALFGQQLGVVSWLQQPAILVSFAAFFVLLALVSFEVIPFRLPLGVTTFFDRLGQRGEAGSLLGCWLTGFASAFVVSPCVSAPLTGALLSVATVGDPLLGAAGLFMLGIGLSVPLMILGATEGRLLPQAGAWLDWVRQGFGLLLLGVALVLIGRVLDGAVMLILWAVLSMLLASWLWLWAGRAQWVTQAGAVLLALWSAILLVGAAQGQQDPWRPLADATTVAAVPVPVQTIRHLDELNQFRQQYPKLLVDVTADWCISCKIMERELFGDQQPAELATWTRVKFDVTQTTAESQAALQALQLFGPPALLFYQQGQLVDRLVGEVNVTQLKAALMVMPTEEGAGVVTANAR